jgi:hypothetical protein
MCTLSFTFKILFTTNGMHKTICGNMLNINIYVLDIDECKNWPCLHGSCSNLISGYKCTCNSGYTGVNCDEGRNSLNSHTYVWILLILLPCLYVLDTVLLKQKKRLVLDITGFFFRMSTQVKAEVHSTKAVTWRPFH